MILLHLDAKGVGGIETHVEALALALNDSGREAAVLLHADHGQTPVRRRFEAAGLKLHFADGTFGGVWRALRRLSPAVLHTHGYKAGVTGRLAARLAGVPVVSTFHAGERGPFPVNLYQAIDEWTSFLGARLAVSPAIAAALPFRATVLPNFVRLPPERAAHASRRIVFVGRMAEEKAPDLFCALAALRPDAGDWHAYGDGPLLPGLKARHGDRVAFHGHVASVSAALDDAALVVMPSRAEGLPMAALEAMARGVPVLAAAVGGLPGLIDDGVDGLLFPPGSIDLAAERLDAFLSAGDGVRAAMAAAARQTIASRHSPAVALPLYLDAYARSAGSPMRSMSAKVQSSAG